MTTAVAAGIHIGPDGIPPPERTLGWQILGWTQKYLLQPDGPKAREAWVYTDEQARFLLNWYAVDAEGRFVYRYGMLRRMKGWGKDPFAASLCCVEFVGPCRFGRWENGQPVAIPHPAAWVETAAVSREQTRNLMTIFPGMISQKAIDQFGIDIGKEIIHADRGRRRIQAVTSSPRSLEGPRVTFFVKDETQHWLAPNEGHEMAKVIARNAAKSRDGSTRVLAISNAHAPGEDSDAEHDYEAWQKIAQGLSTATGILYDSLEAPATDLLDDVQVKAGVLAARGDSEWIDPDRLLAEIRDPRTTLAMARRFYLNQIVAEEDKPFDRKRWDSLVRLGYVVPKEALITLGFDGSLNRDHTALIGTEIRTGYQWVVGYWEPVNRGGETSIPFREVDQTVDYVFETWDVWRMYADPYKWGTYLAKWAGEHPDKVVSWSTTLYRKMAQSLAQYRTAQMSGDLSHDGDRRFAGAIGNAHKHMQNFRDDEGELMWVIQKERPDSPLKIDAAVAGCLSWQARNDAIADGVLEVQEVGVMFVSSRGGA
jgi:hypothetical protein